MRLALSRNSSLTSYTGVIFMTKFSQSLNTLLNSNQALTLNALVDAFTEKSFAVLLLLLLAIPALPLPTGGVTHIFEIIAMLLALELIAGRTSVWLPHSWLSKKLPGALQSSALPKLIRIIKWAEKYSKPRLELLQNGKFSLRIIGLIVFVLTLFAFLAPPFSGLDTLPSLGVVLISLGLIFEDFFISLVGLILGAVGVGLVLVLGKAVFQLF